MGLTTILTRNDGEDVREYKRALKMLKKATEKAMEATEIICVIFEERTISVCRFQCIPVYMSPVPMIGYAYIFHQYFRKLLFFSRYCERKCPIGTNDDASVSVSLLYIMVVAFYKDTVSCIKLRIVFYRSEVCRTQ